MSFPPGATASYGDGHTLTVNADGSYVYTSPQVRGRRGRRVFYVASVPPRFTTENYDTVLFSEGIGRSFVNSLTVTIPATIIPILIAAFAAYALAWMKLPGRGFIIAVIVGLLVVPLQMSLIPLLKLYNATGFLSKTYLGIWLAHTGFGLPFAIYLLRSYIAGLPKDLIESGTGRWRQRLQDLPAHHPAAVIPGAGLLRHLPVPLGVERPARRHGVPRHRGGQGGADLPAQLAARVRAAATGKSSRPPPSSPSSCRLLVFFSLQRYFVRGLLAGSVKGG